ncbi:hypothetical protein [Maribacter sp.]|uniref:hypothetical protein n=1 Tax=Maribacter sp. TaxID=1897614 RepID=UPI003298240B
MNPVVKNILAVVAGVVVGSIVNMGIIMISGSIIPPPEGGDITTMEGLKATMHLFEPKHFIFPFLAHALGTLVGAIVATKIAATRKMLMALIIGLFFLIGGTVNIAMLGGPMWFTALDIIVAYMPMAYIGYILGKK